MHINRRKFLVNPEFQLRFMGYMSIALVLGVLTLYVSNLYYYDLLISEGQEMGLDASHPYFEFIQEQRALLTKVYALTSLLVFAGLMIFGLFMSHRIAGPIYRIESYLIAVSEDDETLAPVKLRDGDFFPEIAGIVNRTIEHFENEHGVVLPTKDEA